MSDTNNTAGRVMDVLMAELQKKSPEQVIDFVECMACACIGLMRGTGDDDYVRGFLDAAIADLKKPSETYVMPSAH